MMKRRTQLTKRDKFDAYCSTALCYSINEMRMLSRMAKRHGTYKVQVDENTTEVYIKSKNTLYVTIKNF